MIRFHIHKIKINRDFMTTSVIGIASISNSTSNPLIAILV